VQVAERTPVSNNDNTQLALMLAPAAPFLPFNLTCLGFNHLIFMQLKHRTPFKPSKINVRRWFPLFVSLALILLMCPGCSMQKRTTQSGWHVESAIWKQKRSPQVELAPSETPALKFPRHLPASSTLPLYTFKRELEQASKRVSETSSLPSSPVEFRPWIVDTLLSDTATNAPQDATRSQGVELTPSALSNAEVPADSEKIDPLTLTALMTLVLGVGVLPSPLGAFLIAIGVIVFLVGRIVKLANKKKSKGRGARIFGNVLLILLAGAFGVFATFVLLLESLFGDATPIQGFFTWLFGG
jgi:hypothetical protein